VILLTLLYFVGGYLLIGLIVLVLAEAISPVKNFFMKVYDGFLVADDFRWIILTWLWTIGGVLVGALFGVLLTVLGQIGRYVWRALTGKDIGSMNVFKW